MSKPYKQYLQDKRKSTLRCTISHHDDHQILLICTNPHCPHNRFLCSMCVPQHQVCTSSLVVISNIAKEDINIANGQLAKDARQIIQNYSEDKKVLEDVDSFYDELKMQLVNEIQQSRNEALTFIDKLFKEKAHNIRQAIDIISSTFNYNSFRILLREMEDSRLSQQDASHRLTLYLNSKERSQKLKEVSHLIESKNLPIRNLDLSGFKAEIKQIEETLHQLKNKLLVFKDDKPVVKPKPTLDTERVEITDPLITEIGDMCRGRKSVIIRGKKFGLQNTTPLSELEFPRDGYFHLKGKKAIFFSYRAMTELLAEGILTSQVDQAIIEVRDKWLGHGELLSLVEMLRDSSLLTVQIRVKSQRIRPKRLKQLQARAGNIKLMFLDG